jgi:hypothetical protein
VNIVMNSIYVISPEQLQATLLENRMKKFIPQSIVQSILFSDFQPDLLHNPTHAFIFINAENKPYAIAEQIRSHYPHCYITFVLTTPDTETIQLFNDYSVSYISLPLTIERYTEIMTVTNNFDVITINANGIDRVVQLKLKKHLRLV